MLKEHCINISTMMISHFATQSHESGRSTAPKHNIRITACITPSVPKKTNLGRDVTHSSTTNLNRGMSRFVVLGCVTSSTRLVFYGFNEKGIWKSLYNKPNSVRTQKIYQGLTVTNTNWLQLASSHTYQLRFSFIVSDCPRYFIIIWNHSL